MTDERAGQHDRDGPGGRGDDPASAVAALRAGGPSAGMDRTSDTSGSDSVSRTRSR
ncbi:hypothetical protein ACFV7R_35750 [Streptomyces sp. NPDC059866]|uniref:hypothetical protein n=1 Tax=Streptomyces sp. NPDC059866 TaxID=3346978 RepID=UPI00364BA597